MPVGTYLHRCFAALTGLNFVRTRVSRHKEGNANLSGVGSASFSLYKTCLFVYNENADTLRPVSVCDVL